MGQIIKIEVLLKGLKDLLFQKIMLCQKEGSKAIVLIVVIMFKEKYKNSKSSNHKDN